MNKIIFDGRITRDPEITTSKTGTEFSKFTVAVDRKIQKGEERKSDFIDCIVFGKSAAFLAKYFHKGDGIVIEGRLESDKYVDKDGNKRTSWSVLVEQIGFPVSSKKQNGSTESNSKEEFVSVNTDDIPF